MKLTLLSLLGFGAVALAQESSFRPLLDPQLSQWEKWLGPVHRAYDLPGYVRGAKPKDDPVLGRNNDPLKVITP